MPPSQFRRASPHPGADVAARGGPVRDRSPVGRPEPAERRRPLWHVVRTA